MQTSLKALLTGVTFMSVSGLGVAGVGTVARAHAALPANLCAAALPADPVLPTTIGELTSTMLRGGGYTFALNQFGPQGLNKVVRQAFGVTPSAGDAVATWSFTLPGGARTYDGLAHVFRVGTQGLAQHACLWGGVGYLNILGHGRTAAQPRAVTVTLDALISVRIGQPGQVDLRVHGAHYLVTSYTLVRQGCRASRSGGLRC